MASPGSVGRGSTPDKAGEGWVSGRHVEIMGSGGAGGGNGKRWKPVVLADGCLGTDGVDEDAGCSQRLGGNAPFLSLFWGAAAEEVVVGRGSSVRIVCVGKCRT